VFFMQASMWVEYFLLLLQDHIITLRCMPFAPVCKRAFTTNPCLLTLRKKNDYRLHKRYSPLCYHYATDRSKTVPVSAFPAFPSQTDTMLRFISMSYIPREKKKSQAIAKSTSKAATKAHPSLNSFRFLLPKKVTYLLPNR